MKAPHDEKVLKRGVKMMTEQKILAKILTGKKKDFCKAGGKKKSAQRMAHKEIKNKKKHHEKTQQLQSISERRKGFTHDCY